MIAIIMYKSKSQLMRSKAIRLASSVLAYFCQWHWRDVIAALCAVLMTPPHWVVPFRMVLRLLVVEQLMLLVKL